MLLILLIVTLTIVSIIASFCLDPNGEWHTSKLCTWILTIALLILILSHFHYASMPAKYKAAQESIDQVRKSGQINENTAVVLSMIELNKDLAGLKYWNESIWIGWYIPDKVAKIPYIK